MAGRIKTSFSFSSQGGALLSEQRNPKTQWREESADYAKSTEQPVNMTKQVFGRF